MIRAPLISAMLIASGAGADIGIFNHENHQAIERQQNEGVNPIARRAVRLAVDSGVVQAPAPAQAAPLGDAEARRPIQVPVWSTEIEIPQAGWVRLQFGDVALAPASDTARESYIRVTSLYDGHEQYLDRDTLADWSYTSAYFNGARLRIEIMASPTNEPGDNRVTVTGASASEPTAMPRTICFGVDDRALSSDPRDARLMPIGCTAWLFGDQPHSLLTAGHCGPGAGDVVQFNVPLSTPGGTPQNPGPQDQYPVDGSSAQATNGGVGNDWAFFGVFANANTGLAPRDAMGDSHILAGAAPASDGRPIRITGYGSTTSPVPASWYLVQKTHSGPLSSVAGTTVRYTTDTTGGNSGSCVVDDDNNRAVGIHTHGGCNSGGGANSGTSIMHPGLQTALDNPLGITRPMGLALDFVGDQPANIDPAGGDPVSIMVLPDNGQTPSGSVTMFVDAGSGFQPVPMTLTAPQTYTAQFPPADCGDIVDYYFTAQDTEGDSWSLPFSGESGPYGVLSAVGVVSVIDDNFEADTGWVVQGVGLSSGGWDRVVPGNFGRSDPASDADGSGRCFVTGNSSNEDVDGGPAYLFSPVLDISTLNDPRVSYARWHESNGADPLTVAFSTNNGLDWTTVATANGGAGDWEPVEHRVSDFVATGGTLMVRFGVADSPNDSVTESGIDGFKVFDILCDAPCPADFDGNGVLDFFDVSEFLRLYNAGDPAADLDSSGTFDFFDVSEFLILYNAGCP